jgi:hypothetical protein
VVKFLRRSAPDNSELSEESLKEAEGIAVPLPKKADIQAVTNAVLRKIDIIQTKGKKIRMLKTLGRLPSAWVPSVFIELLSDESEEIRNLAVKELARREDCPIEKLYERLNRPPWYAKSAVLRLLSLKKPPEAAKHILCVLNDPNADVKCCAAAALGEIGGQEARKLLVRMHKDQNRYVRAAVEQALEKLCDFKFS